jgi:hypothetical protein
MIAISRAVDVAADTESTEPCGIGRSPDSASSFAMQRTLRRSPTGHRGVISATRRTCLSTIGDSFPSIESRLAGVRECEVAVRERHFGQRRHDCTGFRIAFVCGGPRLSTGQRQRLNRRQRGPAVGGFDAARDCAPSRKTARQEACQATGNFRIRHSKFVDCTWSKCELLFGICSL